MRFSDKVSVDTSLFYNQYDSLIYVASILDSFNNHGWGESYGGEIAVTWRPSARWRIEAAYDYLNVQIHGPVLPSDEGNSPHNQAQLRCGFDVTDALELNSALYYVDNVPQVNVDAYWRFDLGVTWRITPKFELAVWGQNLLEPRHREFSTSNVERGGYIMATVRF